jgi:elongation factor G
MDRTGADFFDVVHQMEKYLDANPFPFQMPIGAEDNFEGIIDLDEHEGIRGFRQNSKSVEREIPADLLEQAKEARNNIIAKIADYNEEVADLYLNEEEITVD